MEPLWVGLGSEQLPNPNVSPMSYYTSPTSMFMSPPSSPPSSFFTYTDPRSPPVPYSLPSSPTQPGQASSRPTYRRTSTQALENLAMTDPHALSSSAVAELTSRLSMVGQGLEDWERYGVEPSRDVDGFDPYSRTLQEGGGEVKATPRPGREKRHLYREDAVGETMRRWTLAMTDVPDEVLLDELERLRRGEGAPLREGGALFSKSVQDDEKMLEFGMSTRQVKVKSMSGHEFVYGGPPKRKGKFDIGGVEDEEEEDESEDDACSVDSSSSSGHHHLQYTQEPSHMITSSDSDWTTARRALLCCRDIIRTERSYLALLHQLTALAYPSSASTSSTSHAPLTTRTRSLIYTYLPDLVCASEAFLARLEDDPSAWGVSTALIGCEEEMEGALVRWCGVVGELFAFSSPPPESTSTGVRSRVGSAVGFGLRGRSKSGVGVGEMEVESVYRRRRRAMSWYDGPVSPSPTIPARPQTGLFTVALGSGLAFGLSPPKQPYASLAEGKQSGTLSRTLKSWKRKSGMSQSASSLPAFVQSWEKEKEKSQKGGRGVGSGGGGKKVASVRELAIQPTQRVTRYVLQFRDLLKYTPASSPSKALVERALEAALRIAQRCDRAQDNSAFLRS
ncbi:hypothetical protein EUX98_g2225 [Antrodiella citrinella]|uniref:DH domain-containing protein n=1 Tax=Antrodiella citrinella TaxID=2447956 RepID=A0A4S4N1R0_9APHY|nr:hypothetical protein EUX98_g2225 [Antrodiella citrinella]